MKQRTFIDLFAGGGGLSLGMEQAIHACFRQWDAGRGRFQRGGAEMQMFSIAGVAFFGRMW